MTACPEAFLAYEAEIAYATMAHITDYDVWHTSEEPVTAEKVFATMEHNLVVVHKAIAEAVDQLDINMPSEAHNVLDAAIMVERSQVPAPVLEQLGPIVKRRFSGQ
jgi:5'-methylthioadenosine phosphorylase